jgi:hypothetical protein
MNLLETQITVSLILLMGTIVCGTLPAIIVRYLDNKKRNQINLQSDKKNAFTLSFLMCFGYVLLVFYAKALNLMRNTSALISKL